MKKKTLSILISVLLTLCLLFCFTGCRDDFTKVKIIIVNRADGKEIHEGDTVTVPFTGKYIQITEIFDIKVVNVKNNKEGPAKPTIIVYMWKDGTTVLSDIFLQGKYSIGVEWNVKGELTNYGLDDLWFKLIVE